jgi:ribosomal protein L14E/L6E/L27E
MEEENLKLGQVVRSIAGRDKGNFLVVLKTEETGFASVADGDLRRIEKSKRKKIKHLAKTSYVIEDISDKLTKILKVTNA